MPPENENKDNKNKPSPSVPSASLSKQENITPVTEPEDLHMPGPEDDFTGLNLTKHRLYASEESEDMVARQKDLHSLGITRQPKRAIEQAEDTLAASKYKNISLIRAKRTARVLRFSSVLLLVIFLIVWGVVATLWYRSRVTVTGEQVTFGIDAPQEFTSGEEIIYRVAYKNESRVDWQNVEISFNFPRGFTFRGTNHEVTKSGKQIRMSIGDLASGQEGELHVRGQLIGEQNETATASSEIFVTPANFPSGRFRKTALLATNITALPLELALDIPKDAASGERIVAKLNVRNLSNQALDNVYLRLKPAQSIEFALQDIDFSEGFDSVNSQWNIPTLPFLENQEFTFVFYLHGLPGETRVIDFELGIKQGEDEFSQRELTHVVALSASEVIVQQFYNNSSDPIIVSPGDKVGGQIKYRNVGTTGLKDVIVTASFDGIGFVPQELEVEGGSYDPFTKTVTWSAATYPELAVVQPHEEGTIDYAFTVLQLDGFPLTGTGSKDNVIVSTATVDSPDIPTPPGGSKRVVSDRSVISIRTAINLETSALFDDGRLGLTSSGPIPPKVGEITTYTIRFRVGTPLNDVAEVSLSTVLKDGVTYTGSSYKTSGEMTYNDRTGALTWTIPFLEGGTGRSKPPQELHIQVAVSPGENQIGKPISFLNYTTLNGTDQFVDEILSTNGSELPSSESAVPEQGSVRP